MTTLSSRITRQVRRNYQRKLAKQDLRESKAVERKMNPKREKALRGFSEAMANIMSPEIPPADKPMWWDLADKMNQRFVELSRGKSGKSPARRMFTKSVAFETDRTNDIGHFA